MMNRRQFGLLGGVLGLGWVTGCAADNRTAPLAPSLPPSLGAVGAAGGAQALRSEVVRGSAGSPAAAGTALGRFGSSLLALMPGGENAVLSPYSLYAVLAMARAGAKGATAAQLDAVLGSAAAQAGNMTAVDAAVSAALVAGKAPSGGDPGITDQRPMAVDVANSLWTAPTLKVHQTYLDALAAGFGVGMFDIAFAANPEAARRAINGWVADHTGKLIGELIGTGVISVDTVLVLVNALRLSAPWADPFELTGQPLPFSAPGGSVSATGMTSTGSLRTASGRGWSSVSMPYRGAGLAMTILLPDQGSFREVRADLANALGAATSSREQSLVELVMPTFRSGSHLSLKTALKSLGVSDLFDLSADLSGIAGAPGALVASELIHQAVISVDEKGTEAAAATAMIAVAASGFAGQVKSLVVDRPFIYAVHDTVTGAPLFLGQVTDPTR